MSRRHRIAVIASSRFPLAEPFVGGLEAHVWQLARSLRERGHRVAVFAAPGSDPLVVDELLEIAPLRVSAGARADVSMPPDVVLAEHHAYLSLMLELAGRRRGDFDVVHNHSLHHLPVAMARTLPMPMITTLHTPPTPWLESAMRTAPTPPGTFVAVSACTAAAWSHVVSPEVVPNGVPVDQWLPGPGGESLMWYGRIVPEKGPHLAIRAAKSAGIPLRLAGPVLDEAYFARLVRPELDDTCTYLGHLDQRSLADAVGTSSATLVTPTWDEPYGLVVAESLACGTPVAAFRRGGIPEIVDDQSAVLVPPGDVDALARAARVAGRLSRRSARRRAEEHCSVEQMVDRYVEIFDRTTGLAA